MGMYVFLLGFGPLSQNDVDERTDDFQISKANTGSRSYIFEESASSWGSRWKVQKLTRDKPSTHQKQENTEY